MGPNRPLYPSCTNEVFMELWKTEAVLIPLIVKRPALLPLLVERLRSIIVQSDHAEIAYAAILYTQLYDHFKDSSVMKALLSSLLKKRVTLKDFSIAKRSSILRLMSAASSDPSVGRMITSRKDQDALAKIKKNMNMPAILKMTAGSHVINKIGSGDVVSSC